MLKISVVKSDEIMICLGASCEVSQFAFTDTLLLISMPPSRLSI